MTENFQKSDIIDCSGKLPEGIHKFSHNAMATVFEIIVAHESAGYAEQCVHEAFRELDRLEQELSRFIENSDISRINNSGVGQPVRVGLDTYQCLDICKRLNTDTNKAFDVTVGPLLKFWSVVPCTPSKKELNSAKNNTGMHFLELDRDNFSVTIKKENLCVDLGGFGKGYAVDRMAEILLEWEINSALIHGGASSVLALDGPPGEVGWPVRLRNPNDYDQIIYELSLKNRSVSGSGLRKGQHIIDPRTAYPASERDAAWAISSTAAVSDALSTAFMIMSEKEIENLCSAFGDVQAVIITREKENNEDILKFGKF